ncbi:MAG: MgtC/SapB family protein [Oscillibacter sp.]|jgi:putative Mg2+ transporter-C (MgtC) family protein|nr:MgtC/SapB family protein [Oscillibacter sp.]
MMCFTDYLPESYLTIYDNLEFLIRILLATMLGALVGLERTKRQKEAGVRTHCIIACSAAVFMILSKYAFLDIGSVLGARDGDPARIAAQVVSGISFLGAGVIFKNGSTIRGLTTAAGMWATAAIGMAIGAGMYWVGMIETFFLILIQFVFHRFPIGGDSLSIQRVTICMDDDRILRQDFDQFIAAHSGQIEQSSITRKDGKMTIEADVKLAEPITHQMAMSFMTEHAGVYAMSV